MHLQAAPQHVHFYLGSNHHLLYFNNKKEGDTSPLLAC
jgi:hypothetical protein